jgi:hypothetical protein
VVRVDSFIDLLNVRILQGEIEDIFDNISFPLKNN